MSILYANESVAQAVFVTLVLGGGCAALSGRAIARSWRGIGIAIAGMLPLGLAVRFVHFALFNEPLLSLRAYIIEAGILIVIACLAFQRTRARMMIRQYYWLYEPSGPLSWKLRQDAPAAP
jgi:FtsH-binding integral membrane protein